MLTNEKALLHTAWNLALFGLLNFAGVDTRLWRPGAIERANEYLRGNKRRGDDNDEDDDEE